MKTFIVFQNVASFRVHWKELYRPDAYRLVLIASQKNLERLLAAGQERFFERVIAAGDFSLDALVPLVRGLLEALGVRDLREVRLVTHDEYSLGVVARLREALGVEGDRPPEVESFIDKLQMKRSLEGKGISLPRHLRFDRDAFLADPEAWADGVLERLRLPVFAKPVNESGSVGARRIDTRQALLAWGRAAPQSVTFELDEFITGALFHCDSVIQDEKVILTQVCEYAHPCYDYLSGHICASLTLPRESEEFRRLSAFAEQVLGAIKPRPRNTVTHLEVFRTPGDEFCFLEVAARAPGAMVPFIYAKHLGVNLEQVHFQLQMGLAPDVTPKPGPYCAWVYFPHRPGVVEEVFQPSLQSPYEMTWKVRPGDMLPQPQDIRDMACSLLMWNDSYTALRRDFEYLDREYKPFVVRAAA